MYLRAILVFGALMALIVVCLQVKKSRILVEDAIFWVVISFIILLIAIFTDPIIALAHQLGFMSASNFVYFAIIVMLLWKVFTNSSEISRLKARVNELAQEVALAHMRTSDEKAEPDPREKIDGHRRGDAAKKR